MRSIEFRNEPSYNPDTCNDESDQLTLPLELHQRREVFWLHGEQVKRRRLLGSKTITRYIFEEYAYMPKRTYIDAENISDLLDPDLRYALRMADAADSVGWTDCGEGMKLSHDVYVVANYAGAESRFISADYTGVVRGGRDTFMENLHTAAPSSKV